MTSIQNWRNDFQRFLKGRLKIQQWAELGAVNHLQELAAENRRNSEAEGQWARKHVWSQQPSTGQEQEQADNTMGNTILGDVQYPAPVVVSTPAPPAASPSMLPMALLALASLLPTGAAAGVIGYLLAKDRPAATAPSTPPKPYEDESISIGLGRLEDYEPTK